MVPRNFARTLIAWACVGLAASPVLAASDQTITFCGPVVTLTEHGCIGVKTGGTTYELTEASPKPQVGTVIAGSGTARDAMTTCQEGTHLTGVKWQAVGSCPIGDRRPTGY